jgi:hypothetical protein
MTIEQPGGVPATGAGPIVDLISADPPPRIKSSMSDLLDEALAVPRLHRTRVQEWVDEPHTLQGGRWVDVG